MATRCLTIRELLREPAGVFKELQTATKRKSEGNRGYVDQKQWTACQ